MSDRNLLVEFSLISLIVIVLIGLLLGQVLRSSIKSYALETAANDTKALVERSVLGAINLTENVAGLSAERIHAVQRKIRLNIVRRDVSEVMLVDDQRNIIFALETSRIGDKVPWSEAWSTAKRGESATEVVDVSDDESVRRIVRRHGTLVRIYDRIAFGYYNRNSNALILLTSIPYAPIADRISGLTHSLYLALAVSMVVLYAMLLRVMIRAVSEITRLQTSLFQAQKMKAVGNLTSGLAHDYNNILAVISINLELIEEEISDPRVIEYIKDSQHAVQLGAGLTQRLLAFGRVNSLYPELVNISSLIRDSLPLLQTSAGGSVDVEVLSDSDNLDSTVDKAQLQAAILNLVTNARDAMPDGGKLLIEISTTTLTKSQSNFSGDIEPGPYACIAISDCGVGMSTETIEQAIEPFFTTKDVGSGYGLGLPMVYGFAKQSGGHLTIDSSIDSGTVVKIYLPRVVSTLDKTTVEKPANAGTEEFKDLCVFLVEDNKMLRGTIEKQLENIGCKVYSADDGPSALTLQSSVPAVDLILCDIVLPNGIKGPEVASTLRKRYPSATVVFMSGYSEHAIGREFTLLKKPFSTDELLEVFVNSVSRSWLEKPKQLAIEDA